MPKRARDNSELRFADIASVNPRTSLNGLDPDAPVSFIPMADVDDGGRWVTRQTRPLREVKTGYSPFADGDTLFAKITPCTENGKGCHARGLANGVGFGSTEFHVLRAKKGTDPRLVFHLAQSSDVRWKAAAVMDGSAGQQRVPADFFKICRIAPDILDNQDAKCDLFDAVDAAIDATRGVIEQTRRLKTAVLQDLLTRGLPGRHSEFREVKGLGQVPRAWKHTHIRELCTDIIDCPHTTPNFVDAGVPVIRTSAVRDGVLIDKELTYTSESEYEARTARLVPEPCDIVFTREAPVGEAFVIPEGMRLSLGQRTMLLRPDPTRLDPHFFVSLLYEPRFRRRLLILAGGSTNPHLNVAEVRDLSIATPPIAEQRQITRSLNSMSDRIATGTKHLGQLLVLKTALSQALLTGRVRVPANAVEAV